MSTAASPTAASPISSADGAPARRGPLDFPDSPLSRSARQPLMLGLFLNLQDIRFSDHPTSNSWTFGYDAALARKADAPGFDIAFSRTQWLPKGGYDGEASLDSFVALGAMAATTHTAFGHRGYDSDAVARQGRRDPRHKQGLNLGGNIEIVGTPEQVVEKLAALKDAGIDGVQFNFHDFAPDLDYFAQTTLPPLKQAGLRL